MPLKQCTSDGKSGYKWGDEGKCYTGRDGRAKALRQGRAIEANKGKAALIEYNCYLTSLLNDINYNDLHGIISELLIEDILK